MKRDYIVKKVDYSGDKDEIKWGSIPALYIDCYPWNTNNYRPVTEVKVCYSDAYLHLFFKAFEENVMATYTEINDPVCKDSCVEFFFNPHPKIDNRYMNLEINPLGTFLLSIGENRENRVMITNVTTQTFNIQAPTDERLSPSSKHWCIEYSIPFSFIKSYYKEVLFSSGHKIAANFHKCGDETQCPHYGCWNNIENVKPDFHRPEYFGFLILE